LVLAYLHLDIYSERVHSVGHFDFHYIVVYEPTHDTTTQLFLVFNNPPSAKILHFV